MVTNSFQRKHEADIKGYQEEGGVAWARGGGGKETDSGSAATLNEIVTGRD